MAIVLVRGNLNLSLKMIIINDINDLSDIYVYVIYSVYNCTLFSVVIYKNSF